MSFLAPFFLLGALAIGAPIIFHLIRRTTRERTVFSSLMFFQPTPPRLTKRSRLEHWLLLLLRCLALALLAAGFSRPFFKQTAAADIPSGPTKRVLVLIDVSASMRRADLWADAKARATAVLRSVDASDQVAVFTFGTQAHSLIGFAEWDKTALDARVAFATARIAETSPGWSGTNLGASLVTAAEALGDVDGLKSAGLRQIVLITDLQSGARLEALQAYEWPKGVELTVETLKARNPTNAGVQLLGDAVDTDRQAATTVRVRVSNAADSNREQFKVGWMRPGTSEFVGSSVDTYVPPGQSRILSLPVESSGGAQSIVLRGDDEDFDNTAFLIPPVQQKIDLAYLGSEKAEDSTQPLYFLQRALSDSPRLAFKISPQLPSAPLIESAGRSAALLIVTEAMPAAGATALREQVLAGKTVFVALKSAAAAAQLAPLFGVNQVEVEEGKPASYAMLAEIDFQHPLFAAFADPRFSDFTKIHFWKYRKIVSTAFAGARSIAKFDNGDPALLEIPTGKGRIIILTAGWNPEDSQLAVSSKFVPLIYALLEYSGALTTRAAQYLVGDAIPLATAGAEVPSVTLPDGTLRALAAGATSFADTTRPGVYRVAAGGRTQSYVVNLDAAEMRTAPLAIEELERLGAPLAHSKPTAAIDVAKEIALQSTEAESRQKLWRWFLLATIAVLLGESLLAGRTARKSSPVNVPTSP